MDENVYQVVGFQNGTFQTQDGQLRDYCNLYCLAPFNGAESDHYHFKGLKAHVFKVQSAEVVKDLKPKDHVQLFFNQYQRVSMVQVVNE